MKPAARDRIATADSQQQLLVQPFKIGWHHDMVPDVHRLRQ
jgi:hypothetical protein